MKRLILPILLLGMTSCGNLFDTHPYDINFDGETGINAKRMAKIESQFDGRDTLRVAFISDSHGWYSDLQDEVDNLNGRTDVDFVIHAGDLTDTGTSKEYEWTRNIMNGLRYPYVALIGNHDTSLPKQAFYPYFDMPDRYYAFDCGAYRCLVLDACLNDVREPLPKTEIEWDNCRIDPQQSAWLRRELEGANGDVLIFTHVPFMFEDRETENDHCEEG